MSDRRLDAGRRRRRARSGIRGLPGTGARRGLRTVVAVVAALALAGTIGLASVPAASADQDYPSWQDVQNALNDVKGNQTYQAQVTADIQRLTVAQQQAEEDARQKGEAYGKAQDAADEQQLVVDQLQAQVTTASAQADAAKKQVDGLLSELAKPGKSDLTSALISHPGDAKDLLYKLGAASKLTQTSTDLYAKALEEQNTVQKLTDQANAAKKELDRRQQLAKAAFDQAQAAAKVAEQATADANAHLDELKAQLVALQQKSMAVQAQYEAGLAAAQAAAGAEVNLRTGWARPARGPITSAFGMRYHPIYHIWKLHTGTDIGAGCGAPIFAAHAGTVVYAGWYSDLGNFVEVDHGNGYVTGYGHIVNGGIMVSMGQAVKAGQQIAKVGSTGGSTGCHLHFMVRTGGLFGPVQDPVPFMRSEGMPLG